MTSCKEDIENMSSDETASACDDSMSAGRVVRIPGLVLTCKKKSRHFVR